LLSMASTTDGLAPAVTATTVWSTVQSAHWLILDTNAANNSRSAFVQELP